MADIKITTAQTSGFIPSFWANRALDVLRNQIVLAGLLARDTNFAEAGWKGQTITVPYPGTFTAVDKNPDTPVTPQTPVGGQSVALTLSKHKVVPFLIEDFANAQANMDLMDRYIQPAVVALAEQFENDLWATVMASAGAVVGTPGTDLAAPVVRQANKSLKDNKAPTTDRHLVISTKDEASILGDSNLQTYFAFSQADSVRNGYIGRLYGMNTYYSQLAPEGFQVSIANATGGTFTLTYGGQTTGAIAYNAAPSAVQAALAALSSINAGNVVVGGVAGNYSVVLVAALAGIDTGLTGSATSLTGTGAAVNIASGQKNLAFHRNAAMFAVRPFTPTPPDAGVHTAQAMDPDSGLSIRISAQYDINNVGMRCNLDILYGMTSLRPSQGIIVNS